MKIRSVIKGEKHHWWPKGLSKYWGDERGLVRRIDVTGEVIASKPIKLGKISDGHNILFENESPWQSTIEHYFDEPDQNMPRIVDWLRSFESNAKTKKSAYHRQLTHVEECENFNILRECIISLIVRSPKYRNAQNSFVESFRGELDKSESKRLVASNIHQKYNTLVNGSKGVGKFAVLFTKELEFIYGDGVYSNISASTENLLRIKVAIPMTPNIAVIWSSPMECRTYPRLIPIKTDNEIVEIINNSVQIYSKEYLFFRDQQPNLIDDFKLCEHRIYNPNSDPVDTLIDSLIPDENRKRCSIYAGLT